MELLTSKSVIDKQTTASQTVALTELFYHSNV